MVAPFRIVITGEADAVFLGALLEDVKKITPEFGGFTFEYGTHAQPSERVCPHRESFGSCPVFGCPHHQPS